MKNRSRIAALSLSFAAGSLSASAIAQEAAMPEKCKTQGEHAAMPKDQPMQATTMKDFQKEFMAGMETMDRAMGQGMTKDDPDVAFVCGMIAHHMGAIAMSKTQLKHGDNAEARQMAEKIIDAQTKEIAEMTRWIDANAP